MLLSIFYATSQHDPWVSPDQSLPPNQTGGPQFESCKMVDHQNVLKPPFAFLKVQVINANFFLVTISWSHGPLYTSSCKASKIFPWQGVVLSQYPHAPCYCEGALKQQTGTRVVGPTVFLLVSFNTGSHPQNVAIHTHGEARKQFPSLTFGFHL